MEELDILDPEVVALFRAGLERDVGKPDGPTEKKGVAPTGRFTPALGNKVQTVKHPDLKPKTTLDFLFKYCQIDLQAPLSLLQQLRDQKQPHGIEKQTPQKGLRIQR